jgi:hypothetical protein
MGVGHTLKLVCLFFVLEAFALWGKGASRTCTSAVPGPHRGTEEPREDVQAPAAVERDGHDVDDLHRLLREDLLRLREHLVRLVEQHPARAHAGEEKHPRLGLALPGVRLFT